MCGIVGYMGKDDIKNVLISGLKALEYRGYDSSGIAVVNESNLTIVKRSGRISELESALKHKEIKGACGIGHTRWATHGNASEKNAHPFSAGHNKIAVVHNGIISNYLELYEKLALLGINRISDTDSEVVAHLIDFYYTGDMLSAIRRAVNDLKGSFALGIISIYEPNVLYGVRKDSPLIVGKGESGACVSSDLAGIADSAEEFAPLENDEIVKICESGIELYDFNGARKELSFSKMDIEREDECVQAGSKMLCEIRQVPDCLFATAKDFYENNYDDILFEHYDEILVIGCGSAYHAGLVFKSAMRELCGVRTETIIASEFISQRWEPHGKTLVIAVSQSGETADTLLAVKRAKAQGATILSVCNVRASSLVRMSNRAIITRCGVEQAVAATKSYSTQVQVLILLCLEYARNWEKISPNEYFEFKSELLSLPEKANNILELENYIDLLCREITQAKAVFFLGRGIDFDVAKEGSLKLKEVSYIFSEAYPSGELKHGTLALMESGVQVICVATNDKLIDKNYASLQEVKCRGAGTLCITCEQNVQSYPADYVIAIPDCSWLCSPVLSTIAMQYVAYFMSAHRGLDMDKPRNLAKSVTVE